MSLHVECKCQLHWFQHADIVPYLRNLQWHKSLNADCPQVRRCIEIAQACVDDDQHKRFAIDEIIHKLDELETIVDSPAIS